MTAVEQRNRVTSAPASPLPEGSGLAPSPPPTTEFHPAHPILERPEPTVRRGNVRIARPPGQSEQTQTPAHPPAATDLESQNPAHRTKPRAWFWQKQSWKGLQSKLAVVIVSGLLLAISLAIYLGLALTPSLQLRHQWHIVLILIILLSTMLFCHALLRLCIVASNPSRFQRLSRNFSRIPSVARPGGYANPTEPIRINTVYNGDDLALVDPTKSPPPVYGLWRCSVRVNPDQFYWVRRNSASVPAIPEERETDDHRGSGATTTSPRPPSYSSDAGTMYATVTHTQRPHPEPQAPLPM